MNEPEGLEGFDSDETTRMDLAEIAQHAMMIGVGRTNSDVSARSIRAECALARDGRRARAGEDAIHPGPGSQPHPEPRAGQAPVDMGCTGIFHFSESFPKKISSGLFSMIRHSLRDRKTPIPNRNN